MIGFERIGWTLMCGNLVVFAMACAMTMVLGDPAIAMG